MSAMTGESEPVSMTVESNATDPLDATNLAWSSAYVVDGEGVGVVFKIGDGWC